ncbi:hypothetical protein AAHB33_10745 [Paenarthrobacter sp. S56]|uniref:hypothetical protein n=1 Tax=Paenarthrobacter sp. S56 TaxID=3138179 RepID=UPI00321B089B
MATDIFARFLHECLVIEEDTDDGMDLDTLYGLYISWCGLAGVEREPEQDFLSSIRQHHLRWGRREGSWVLAGLKMVGPAARDYVVCSAAPLYAAGTADLADLSNEAA